MFRTDEIDWSNPVVREHPLLRGLRAWWIPGYPMWGGKILKDALTRSGATGGNNNGTLTNGPTWNVGAGNPGGLPALNYVDGSNTYVNMGANSRIEPNHVTFICSVRATSFPNSYNTTLNWSNAGSSYCQLFVKSTGKLALYTNTKSYDGTGAFTLSANLWYRLALTYDGALSGYVNGRLDAATSGGGANLTSGPNFYVGQDTGIGSGREWNGLISDAKVYDRGLSAREIALEFAEWKRGFPETLRRLTRRAYYLVSAPAGGTILPFVNHYMLG